MKKSTIVCAAILAVAVIVMAILIIVGINRNNQTDVSNKTDTTAPIAETTVPEETTLESDGNSETDDTPTVPAITPATTETDAQSEDVDLDMNAPRDSAVSVVNDTIETGTKDDGNEE